MAKESRTSNNVYVLNEIKGKKYYIGKVDEKWLWHRRMSHINFDNIVKIKTSNKKHATSQKSFKHYLRAMPAWEIDKSKDKGVLNNKAIENFPYRSPSTNKNVKEFARQWR